MSLRDLAFKVNVCIPISEEYIPNDEPEEKMNTFIQAAKEDTSSILNADGHNGWQIGQAFYYILRYHRNIDKYDIRFCVAACIISLIKALEMGTMQSVLAIQKLLNLIKAYKNIFEVYFLAMPNERMTNDFNMPQSALLSNQLSAHDATNMRMNCFVKFMIALAENKLDLENPHILAGRFYTTALYADAYNKIDGFDSFGVVI